MVLTTRKSVSLLRLDPMVKAMLRSNGSNLLPNEVRRDRPLYHRTRLSVGHAALDSRLKDQSRTRRKKSSLSDRKSPPRRSLEEAARDAREASARQGPLPRRWRAGDFRLDRDRRVPRRALRTAAPDALRSGAPNAC